MKSLIYIFLTVIIIFGTFLVQVEQEFDPDKLPEPISENDYGQPGSAAKVELGRLLFFDKILSGNKNISCATCHHPDHATSDGLSLGFGEGAIGLGTMRKPGTDPRTGIHERVPRNSPALFNIGAKEYTTMFHDGRVEVDTTGYYASGFISPAKWKLPAGLDNVLAAQAMFPVTSPTEMAGQKGENPIADAVSLSNAAGPGGVWEQLGERLREIPEYVELFEAAYPDDVRSASDVNYVLAANAIAAFEAEAFRRDRSAFDKYLESGTGLAARQERGMKLFYGRAKCVNCHSGKFLTDHKFHGIAMPQIGPGKSDGNDHSYWSTTGLQGFPEDFGRGRVTFREKDNFRFRTPSLRNVALTGPWGHDGAYDSLTDIVRHHLDPVNSLTAYRLSEKLLPPISAVVETTAEGPMLINRFMSEKRLRSFLQRDSWVMQKSELRDRIASANELERISLSDSDIADLVSFLESLTDPSVTDLGDLVPDRVPSGLPVSD